MTEPFESLIANWETRFTNSRHYPPGFRCLNGTPPKNLWKRFQTVEQTKATANGAKS